MKKFQIWFGSAMYIEVHSWNERMVQEAWHANMGVWIPADNIKEVTE